MESKTALGWERPLPSPLHLDGAVMKVIRSPGFGLLLFLALSVTFKGMPLFPIWEKGAVSFMFRDIAEETQTHNKILKMLRTSNDLAELTSHTTMGIPKKGRDYF